MEPAATPAKATSNRTVSFLVDTDICSAYLKGNNHIANRFIQYGGRLYISALTVGELYTWALRAKASPKRLQGLLDMFQLVQILDVNEAVGKRFGELEATMLDQGKSAPDINLFNAAVALVHGLTLVTHNLADYVNVPGLTIADWLTP